MHDLFNIADTKQIGEFESVRPSTLTLDDLGKVDEPEQLIDIVSVWRVRFADLDLVTFLNETTGEFRGTKLYKVYEAEQEARLKKPNLDEAFNELLNQEVSEIEGGYREEPSAVA